MAKVRGLAVATFAGLAMLAATQAKADFVFEGQQDLSGLGFGNDPRLLTQHTPTGGSTDIETGAAVPFNQATGDAVPGANKTNTPTLSALGWAAGNQVQLAFDPSQTGGTGLTLQTMGIQIYDPTGQTVIATFQLGGPFQVTPAQVDANHGNGNGVLVFGLTSAEQAQFNALSLNSGDVVGSFGSWGCHDTSADPAGCMPANDGQDTLVGVMAVPGPEIGAGLPGIVTGCLGLIALGRRRIKRLRGLAV